MVLGDDAMDWLATRPGIEAMTITQDHHVIRTAGFARPSLAAVV